MALISVLDSSTKTKAPHPITISDAFRSGTTTAPLVLSKLYNADSIYHRAPQTESQI